MVKVYSHVIYRRASHPAYQDRVPYNVSLIELDEGLRMVSNVVNCDAEKVYTGMPLEVIYEDLGEYTLPKFRPVEKNS